MEEIGEFELLEPLSQALKEAADKKSKQIYGEWLMNILDN